jgi:hypothetical protein
MKILYLQKVEIYLFKLIRQLYHEQYFAWTCSPCIKNETRQFELLQGLTGIITSQK